MEKNQLQYWFAKVANINSKGVETVLEQICALINYPKFEWTSGYIIEKFYHLLIFVTQNDVSSENTQKILDQNKETIKR